MKPYIIIIILFISSLFSFAQNKYKDVIYPEPGLDSIADCHILKIRKWNTIIYEKDDAQDTVKAIAVVKKGRFIDFRSREEIKNNTYPILNSPPIQKEEEILTGEELYQFNYKKAVNQKRTGLVVACIGVGCSITAIYSLSQNGDFLSPSLSSSIFIAGGVLFNFGVPMWISNSVKAKKSKEAILKFQDKQISMNIGVTNNGAGLVIKF